MGLRAPPLRVDAAAGVAVEVDPPLAEEDVLQRGGEGAEDGQHRLGALSQATVAPA